MSDFGAVESQARYEGAIARFKAEHRRDPRTIEVGGTEVPWSVHYHDRMLHWLGELHPDASEPLRLAAACQHIRRWESPRSDYEEGRKGYKQWRSDLAVKHAEHARKILEDVGYDEKTISRVETFLRKLGLARDEEVRQFEDAICMVFFENEYVDLAHKYDDDKMVDILQRTWRKMSPVGHEAALAMAGSLPDRERRLVEVATADG